MRRTVLWVAEYWASAPPKGYLLWRKVAGALILAFAFLGYHVTGSAWGAIGFGMFAILGSWAAGL